MDDQINVPPESTTVSSAEQGEPATVVNLENSNLSRSGEQNLDRVVLNDLLREIKNLSIRNNHLLTADINNVDVLTVSETEMSRSHSPTSNPNKSNISPVTRTIMRRVHIPPLIKGDFNTATKEPQLCDALPKHPLSGIEVTPGDKLNLIEKIYKNCNINYSESDKISLLAKDIPTTIGNILPLLKKRGLSQAQIKDALTESGFNLNSSEEGYIFSTFSASNTSLKPTNEKPQILDANQNQLHSAISEANADSAACELLRKNDFRLYRLDPEPSVLQGKKSKSDGSVTSENLGKSSNVVLQLSYDNRNPEAAAARTGAKHDDVDSLSSGEDGLFDPEKPPDVELSVEIDASEDEEEGDEDDGKSERSGPESKIESKSARQKEPASSDSDESDPDSKSMTYPSGAMSSRTPLDPVRTTTTVPSFQTNVAPSQSGESEVSEGLPSRQNPLPNHSFASQSQRSFMSYAPTNDSEEESSKQNPIKRTQPYISAKQSVSEAESGATQDQIPGLRPQPRHQQSIESEMSFLPYAPSNELLSDANSSNQNLVDERPAKLNRRFPSYITTKPSASDAESNNSEPMQIPTKKRSKPSEPSIYTVTDPHAPSLSSIGRVSTKLIDQSAGTSVDTVGGSKGSLKLIKKKQRPNAAMDRNPSPGRFLTPVGANADIMFEESGRISRSVGDESPSELDTVPGQCIDRGSVLAAVCNDQVVLFEEVKRIKCNQASYITGKSSHKEPFQPIVLRDPCMIYDLLRGKPPRNTTRFKRLRRSPPECTSARAKAYHRNFDHVTTYFTKYLYNIDLKRCRKKPEPILKKPPITVKMGCQRRGIGKPPPLPGSLIGRHCYVRPKCDITARRLSDPLLLHDMLVGRDHLFEPLTPEESIIKKEALKHQSDRLIQHGYKGARDPRKHVQCYPDICCFPRNCADASYLTDESRRILKRRYKDSLKTNRNQSCKASPCLGKVNLKSRRSRISLRSKRETHPRHKWGTTDFKCGNEPSVASTRVTTGLDQTTLPEYCCDDSTRLLTNSDQFLLHGLLVNGDLLYKPLATEQNTFQKEALRQESDRLNQHETFYPRKKCLLDVSCFPQKSYVTEESKRILERRYKASLKVNKNQSCTVSPSLDRVTPKARRRRVSFKERNDISKCRGQTVLRPQSTDPKYSNATSIAKMLSGSVYKLNTDLDYSQVNVLTGGEKNYSTHFPRPHRTTHELPSTNKDFNEFGSLFRQLEPYVNVSSQNNTGVRESGDTNITYFPRIKLPGLRMPIYSKRKDSNLE